VKIRSGFRSGAAAVANNIRRDLDGAAPLHRLNRQSG
jgi:hypothetical protein